MESQRIYNDLIQSLRLVASESDIQLASLPDFVVATDEIALIYYDAYIMIPQISNMIPYPIIKKLDELNELFGEMSKDKSLWNTGSFKDNDYWSESRKLGRTILEELNEEYSIPDLDFIKWVR